MKANEQLEININAGQLRRFRIQKRESQTIFWSRFGVTQSRGSRFELGVEIPPSIQLLLKLYFSGIIKDEDLRFAHEDYLLHLVGKDKKVA